MQVISVKFERGLLIVSIFQHVFKLAIPFYLYVVKGKNYYGQDCYVFDELGRIKEYLPTDKMNLKMNYEGQFQIFVFQKCIGEN